MRFHARTRVTITLDRATGLGSVVASASGTFCTTVRLPARVLGSHTIRANDNHGRVASASIRIVRSGAAVAGVSLSAAEIASGGTTSGTGAASSGGTTSSAGAIASGGTTSGTGATTDGGTTSGAGTTSSGELASTGTALIGIGALGGLLLLGGGLMLFSGRRRKTVF